ncbi:MAG: AbrB/MazE/SpoVT family DNA-binding domain-containing protein [Candidatus Sigynarchaeota archaeon]
MEKIKAKLIKIGNSQGIRLPKHVIDRLNFTDEIELVIDDDAKQILMRPIGSPRKGWEKSFQEMHAYQDDIPLIDDGLDLDNEDWEW